MDGKGGSGNDDRHRCAYAQCRMAAAWLQRRLLLLQGL